MKYKITENGHGDWNNSWIPCFGTDAIGFFKGGTFFLRKYWPSVSIWIVINGISYEFCIEPHPTNIGLKRIAKRLLAEKLKEKSNGR